MYWLFMQHQELTNQSDKEDVDNVGKTNESREDDLTEEKGKTVSCNLSPWIN